MVYHGITMAILLCLESETGSTLIQFRFASGLVFPHCLESETGSVVIQFRFANGLVSPCAVVYHGTCTMVILWPPYSKSFTGTSGGRTHDLLHASPAPCGLCYQPSRRQRCEKSNTFDGTDICASQPVKVVDVPLSACSTRDWTAVSWNGGDNWAYL